MKRQSAGNIFISFSFSISIRLNNTQIIPEIGYYLAGFADAEASFNISFIKKIDKNENTSWKIRPCFNVCQKERHVLTYFETYLGCGDLHTTKNNITTFSVWSYKDLCEKVIPFFIRFPFESIKKKRDLLNFVKALKILKKPVNMLSISDIKQILALRINTKTIVNKRIYSDEYLLENWPKPFIIEKPMEVEKPMEEIKKSSETTMSKSESVINTLNDMIESDLYRDIKAENALDFYIALYSKNVRAELKLILLHAWPLHFYCTKLYKKSNTNERS